ncbi:MAG: tetratricopeptide repeat protein [Caldilineaceae bacterium]
MVDPAPPVILLAFASSEDPRFQSLPRLPEEARLLRDVLEPAETEGLIKLEIRQNATLDDILRAFDRHRGRIAVFHFAGHTDDQTFLAERLLGAEALLSAVHAQSELKLVFLNACENQAHADGLHAAGVPAAIVTTEEVHDDLCPTFAMRFYRALASGFTLAQAFAKARLAAEGEANEQSGRFGPGPWRLSTPDPAAGGWRLSQTRKQLVPLQKPQRVRHFTDREQELAKLLADLHPGKIVTLCGAGGMGKSALAAEAIWTFFPGDEPNERFPDGVIYHTFYHQPQAALALEKIARAYGVNPRSSPRDAALQALAGKTALLVLDGTEVADDLAAVLDVAGNCGILLTTKRHADSPDAFVDIQPLPRSESLDLLRAWAGKYAAEDLAANDIVRLLGGLPLALYLTGRYLVQTNRQADEYVAWLQDEGLEALHFGERPSKSVPLVLQRSLDQVSERAQQAFMVAGILALKPFSADVIGAGLDISVGAASHALGELVDYALVRRTDRGHEVTHALAHDHASRLGMAESAIVTRVIMWSIEELRATAIQLPPNFERLDKWLVHFVKIQEVAFELERWEDVRQLAREMMTYLDRRGLMSQRIQIAETALNAADKASDQRDRAAFLVELGFSYFSRGEPQYAIKHYLQALEIYRTLDDTRGISYSLDKLGEAYLYQGDIAAALSCHEEQLDLAAPVSEGEAAARLGHGVVHLHQGCPQEAIRWLEQAVEILESQILISRKADDKEAEARIGALLGSALGNLGLAYAESGDTRHAVTLYRQRLELARRVGDVKGESNGVANLGRALADLDEGDDAVMMCREALKFRKEIGYRVGEAQGYLGYAYSAAKKNRSALYWCEKALEEPQTTLAPRAMCRAHIDMSLVLLAVKRPDEAAVHAEEAVILANQHGYRLQLADALWALAQAQEGTPGVSSVQCAEQALVHFMQIGHPRAQEISAWLLKGVGSSKA